MKRAAIGEDHVQGLDFKYTINGWTKAVNHPALLKSYDPGQDSITNGFSKDVFGMVLGYHNNDFNRTNSPFNPSNALLVSSQNNISPLFNGNISNWTIKTDTVQLMGLKYRYDQLNRIKAEDYNVYSASWNNSITDFDNSFTFDPNGNILTAFRNGTGANNKRDSLYGRYAVGKNRLDHIDDDVTGTSYSNEIFDQDTLNNTYDEIGERIKDVEGAIDTITWSVYKKITGIDKTTGEKIRFTYNSNNEKIKKTYISASSDTVITYYVRDPQGNILSIYERKREADSLVYKQTEIPIYGSERVGEYKPNILIFSTDTNGQNPYWPTKDTTYFTRVIAQKEYELNDHLGSTRVIVSDRKTTTETALVKSYTNYYAYGIEIPSKSINTSEYRFKYNGKESVNEVFGASGTFLDYGMRELENRGWPVFLRPDPLIVEGQEYPELSSYQYASNTPIQAVDLDGLEAGVSLNDPNLGSGGGGGGPVFLRRVATPKYVPRTSPALVKPPPPVVNGIKPAAPSAYAPGQARQIPTSPGTTKMQVPSSTQTKKVPNPYGKKGGPQHQQKVEEVKRDLQEQGFDKIKTEVEVKTPQGEKSKRYIDVQGVNSETGQTKSVQVGRQTKGEQPIARERRALDDIEKVQQRPSFVPYSPKLGSTNSPNLE